MEKQRKRPLPCSICRLVSALESVPPKYDRIGLNYAQLRRPDPRIAAQIHRALGEARRIVNVGAGTGSYEPSGREVVAVEPSAEMIAQRPVHAAKTVMASAEALPFDDNSFDAAMAVLTIHHWKNQRLGLAEMRRVTRGPVIVLTFDPAARPWLTDYPPQLAELDEQQMPAMQDYETWMDDVTIEPVRIPSMCSDGFLYAYWDRPEAYLDPHLRSGSSSFWALERTEHGLERLRHDLESNAWHERYGELAQLDSYDAGYRLVISA